MKKIIILFLIFVVVLAAFSLLKNGIASLALSGGVKAMTGLGVQVRGMDVGILKTLIGIRELKVSNPRGFPDRVMADIPELYVDYDLGAFLKGKVHLEEVRLYLKELIVVKNAKGELNLDALKPVQARKEEGKSQEEKKEAKMPEMQIDLLKLKIGKVIYKDYTQNPPAVTAFDVNIDEQYENINDPYIFASLIVSRALLKTTIARLANFDVQALQGDVTAALKKYRGLGKGAVQETTEVLKKIFPFGKSEE